MRLFFTAMLILVALTGMAANSNCVNPGDDDDDVSDDDTGDDDTVVDDDTVDDDTVDDDTGDDDTVGEDWPTCDDYADAITSGNVADSGLDEISGIAVSADNPGVLWMHNDSGDGPFIYALSTGGDLIGTVQLSGVSAVDWEDMAIGPCGDDHPDVECLYIADFGDNGASRTDVAIYRVPEPAVDPFTPFGTLAVSDFDKVPFAYPGGSHDAEALVVHPDGTVYVIDKDVAGIAGVYEFPDFEDGRFETLDYLGDLGDPEYIYATGADLHRNGDRLLVRTYTQAWEYRLPDGADFADVIDVTPSKVPRKLEAQSEAIAYDPATGGYFHVSEGTTPPIYFFGCLE